MTDVAIHTLPEIYLQRFFVRNILETLRVSYASKSSGASHGVRRKLLRSTWFNR